MALTNLFTVGTTDLTKWEKTEDHDVNLYKVYDTWTDGNWVDHRVNARTRVTGKVTLGFSKEADMTSFLSTLSANEDAEGYYPITVWCSNTNSTATVNAFLDIVGDTKWDVTCPRKYHEIEVTITGR